jgi:hypothetical protein
MMSKKPAQQRSTEHKTTQTPFERFKAAASNLRSFQKSTTAHLKRNQADSVPFISSLICSPRRR